MTETISLYGRARDGLSLESAVAICSPALEPDTKPAIGLIYSPRRCEFVRLENKTLRDSQGRPAPLGGVFEVRMFNEQAEMRWLHEANGLGRTALLSGSNLPIHCEQNLPEDVSLTALRTLEQTYLLWGEGIDEGKAHLAAGWSRLTAARIGRLDVPIGGIRANQRVELKVIEYLAEYDSDGNLVQSSDDIEEKKRYGNAAVAEERLLRLEVA